MNMQRISLTINGSTNWHIWLQYLMYYPCSTPVFKEKIRLYFPKLAKLMHLKEKWTTGPIVSKNDFSSFRFLNEFLIEDFKTEDTAEIKELMLEHLKLMQKNFNQYFLEEESEAFRLLKWVVNPFIFI